jgi:hypothetical protein
LATASLILIDIWQWTPFAFLLSWNEFFFALILSKMRLPKHRPGRAGGNVDDRPRTDGARGCVLPEAARHGNDDGRRAGLITNPSCATCPPRTQVTTET